MSDRVCSTKDSIYSVRWTIGYRTLSRFIITNPTPLVFSDDDEDELVDRNCSCCSRCCMCYIPWLKFQNFLYRIVSDLIFELFITLCILLNVITMALDKHGESQEYYDALTYANYVSTCRGVYLVVFLSTFRIQSVLHLISDPYAQCGGSGKGNVAL